MVKNRGGNKTKGKARKHNRPRTLNIDDLKKINGQEYAHVTEKYGATNPITEELYIRFLLENGLDHAPGTQYAYSNIGYLVLGEIIEQYSGMTYEAYLQTQIMQPLAQLAPIMKPTLQCDFFI